MGGGEPQPPPFPSRVKMFVYGCALWCAKRDAELASGQAAKKATQGLPGMGG